MAIVLSSALLLIAVLRIVSTYRVFSQAYDEPAHIACGMEWLANGTYTLEPLHPPLARVAAALGPYLSGLRLPALRTLQDPLGSSYDIFGAGNEILGKGDYFRTLTLARLGILPFFVLSVAVVFLWSRKLFGDWAALLAVLTYTTLPPILGFFGVAYTDPVLAALLPWSLFSFSNWLEKFTVKRSLILGVTTGLAVLSKLTALLFLPPCFLVILAAKWMTRDGLNFDSPQPSHPVRRCAWTVCVAALMTVFVIWAGFRFSLERIQKTPQEIAALSRLPVPLRSISTEAIHLFPWVPAEAFFQGIAADLRMNAQAPPSYFLGKIRRGGWWYFFIITVALKTPIAFLVLSGVGTTAILLSMRTNRDWRPVVPLLSVFAMLVVTMPTKINYGVRHVLVLYPLLTTVAGKGALYLWESRTKLRPFCGLALFLLLAWQIVSTARAHPDYLSYFNELGDKNSADYLLWGCDLDCGQDTQRLAEVLKQRGINNATLCVFTSADLNRLGLSHFERCVPYRRDTGWFAASIRLIRTGDAFWNGNHPDAYSWLTTYTPVTSIGKTILLYYIPPEQMQTKPTRKKL